MNRYNDENLLAAMDAEIIKLEKLLQAIGGILFIIFFIKKKKKILFVFMFEFDHFKPY